jgi:hypothetical protein
MRQSGVAAEISPAASWRRYSRADLNAGRAKPDGTFSQLVEFDTARIFSIRLVCVPSKSRKVAPRRPYFWIMERTRPSPYQRRHIVETPGITLDEIQP